MSVLAVLGAALMGSTPKSTNKPRTFTSAQFTIMAYYHVLRFYLMRAGKGIQYKTLYWADHKLGNAIAIFVLLESKLFNGLTDRISSELCRTDR
ncbi:hypothetical protein [Pseudanabaena sp. UWO310]|uniref:hypothetical protein n=1 Tax=Pseudanabaena sp. UWO310 TaxID=2480795 RepID=UPI001680C163|nr:hypothetical protein [Pseudanabaena sp. UWO310]